MEMGFIKGATLKVKRVAPLGDPIEIRIKGYYISLRKEEAKNIEIEIMQNLEISRVLVNGKLQLLLYLDS
jgi:hypothetical protein